MTGFHHDASELRVIADLLEALNRKDVPSFGAMDGVLDIYWYSTMVGQILRDGENGHWYYKAGGEGSE